MNIPAAKTSVAQILALVSHSARESLPPESEEALAQAIRDFRESIDADTRLDRNARFLHENAHLHLLALKGIHSLQPQRVEWLLQDCERFLKLLENEAQ